MKLIGFCLEIGKALTFCGVLRGVVRGLLDVVLEGAVEAGIGLIGRIGLMAERRALWSLECTEMAGICKQNPNLTASGGGNGGSNV